MIDRRLDFAETLAEEAGQLARRMRAEHDNSAGFASSKGRLDFVTAADLAVEALIRERIAAAFPKDQVFGEEQGGSALGGAEPVWIVDPIDGTTNFMRGLPEWGVSIACVQGAEITHGVIELPDLKRQLSAQRGCGLRQRGGASAPQVAGGAIAMLGHSPRVSMADHLSLIEGLWNEGIEYRRPGAACFGLAAVALGWAEMSFEAHLNLWDVAAGILLVQESGGRVAAPSLLQMRKAGGPVAALGANLPVPEALAAELRAELGAELIFSVTQKTAKRQISSFEF